jgi:flagellin
MRELSIQSANGTYDDGNRSTLNAEVQQLISELDRIAETTAFNGLNILDGTLGAVDLQVGSEANQTITLEVQAMDAKTLGLGSTSFDSMGASTDLNSLTALGNNDVMINGQSVMAVGESFDGSSDPAQDLLDAINNNVSGVTASMVSTTEYATTGTGVLSGAEEINITVTKADGAAVVYDIRNTENMDEVVDAINSVGGGALSASLNDDNELVVSAEGAASIAIADNSALDAALGGDSSSNGKILLESSDGGEITIQRGSSGTLDDLEDLGFRESDGAGELEGIAPTATTAFQIGDLQINGVDIGASDSGTLDDKIAAINSKTDETGVQAKAFTSTFLEFDSTTVTTLVGGNVSLNGIDVTLTGTPANLQVWADDLNGSSDQTGITATVSGTRLLLEGDVSAISFGDELGGAGTLAAAVTDGTNLAEFEDTDADLATGDSAAGGIKLESLSGNAISVKHDADGATRTGLLDSNSLTDDSFGTSIASLDISTAVGAQKAIDVIDNALDTINETRGDLGAINNRLDFTVNNLSNVSENVSAARSRIEDADFASESAALSRAQVLQQAGTAMLAQANAAPQQVLSLLQ